MLKIGLKLVKLLYKKLIRPQLKKYVEKTDNDWDDKALEFLDTVIDIVLVKIGDVKQLESNIDQELKSS